MITGDRPDAGPTRVLVMARDRRFRSVASMLLQRRGYSVSVGSRTFALPIAARRSGAEVVVLDPRCPDDVEVLAATWAANRDRTVGLVVVSDEPMAAPGAARVVDKWAMHRLSEAIDSVRPVRTPA
jgi:DNA-binding NtrC family response regulator